MFKILVVGSDTNNACDWYRGSGPWSAFAKEQRGEVDVTFDNNPSFGTIREADVVFMMRPSSERERSLFDAAKSFGVKTWVDYDDDLFQVPTDNPAHEIFSKPQIQTDMHHMIHSADLVTVSTDALHERWQKVNTKIEILYNCFDERLTAFRKEGPQQKIVLWRGSPTHARDMHSYADEIVYIAKKFPDHTFAFVGSDPVPWDCSEKILRAARFPHMDMVTYMKAISELRPEVMIVPLHDSLFNRSKSSIAALEAGFAGSVIVCPNWEEWRWTESSSFSYDTPATFQIALEKSLSITEEERMNRAKDLWAFAMKSRFLDKQNEHRFKILESLIAGPLSPERSKRYTLNGQRKKKSDSLN